MEKANVPARPASINIQKFLSWPEESQVALLQSLPDKEVIKVHEAFLAYEASLSQDECDRRYRELLTGFASICSVLEPDNEESDLLNPHIRKYLAWRDHDGNWNDEAASSRRELKEAGAAAMLFLFLDLDDEGKEQQLSALSAEELEDLNLQLKSALRDQGETPELRNAQTLLQRHL